MSVCWMGSSVITMGPRHVKVWRIDQGASTSPSKTRTHVDPQSATTSISPAPRTFLGRNCLLGPLIDSQFSHSVAVSDCKAILSTVQGDICLLDDTNKSQKLEVVAKAGFGIFAITFDRQNGLIWCAGEGGLRCSVLLDDLVKRAAFSDHDAVPSLTLSPDAEERPDILAIGIVQERLVTVGSNHAISIGSLEPKVTASALPRITKSLPAHGDCVLGVRSLLPKVQPNDPDLLTFSTNGDIHFWMLVGSCTATINISLEQLNRNEGVGQNELKVLVASVQDDILVTGDRSGVLRYCFGSSNIRDRRLK